MDVKWIGAANVNWQMGRAGLKPEALVIHLADGSLIGTDEWFLTARPLNPTSAHYGVGKDGSIHQYVKDVDRAFHAGNVVQPTAKLVLAKKGVNPNLWTIGIEHEGRMTDVGPWSDAQIHASAELIVSLAKQWSIPIDRDHIFGHHEVYAVKPCPGPGIDLDALVSRAAALAAESTT